MIGLFIGRFQPFHLGHFDALEQIQTECDHIKIGIGSSQYSNTEKNPFDFETRKKMIEAHLPRFSALIEIFAIPDIHNPPLWVDHVVHIVGDFDQVYSGNDQTLALFQSKNYKTTKLKFNTKISGTEVREKMKNKLSIKQYVPNNAV